jgi:hypothetical protein
MDGSDSGNRTYWRWFGAIYLVTGTGGGLLIFLALPPSARIAGVALLWAVFYLVCGIASAIVARWMSGRRS